MYKNALHNRGTDNIQMFDDHNGPISGLSINHSPEHDFLNGLVLTSSFDWTVKLWNPSQEEKLVKTFESSEDFIYDVKWNPANPSLFATVNNDGYIDLFDLTRDTELPVVHKKVNNFAQNKMAWNTEGSAMVSGDSAGNVHLFGLGEKYRKVDSAKLEGLKKGVQMQEGKTSSE
jgi:dynein intermediate chain, cytosolic